MPSVDKHFGAPVFFSVLSRAQTFSTGSFNRSSETVTRSAVPSTCFMCVIEPVSCALKVRTTLKVWDRIRTWPSLLPMKRLSDPEQTQLRSLLLPRQYCSRQRVRTALTSNIEELSPSSGGLTSETSKKLKTFH